LKTTAKILYSHIYSFELLQSVKRGHLHRLVQVCHGEWGREPAQGLPCARRCFTR